jgi:tRNA-splicing ligase RtcB
MKTYSDPAVARAALIRQGPAEWLLPITGRKPVILIANDAIMAGFDNGVFEQAVNTAEAPGIDQLIVGPDAHKGYGMPVGSILLSKTHLYPGVVGPDICCSMSFLQTDLPDEALTDKRARRAVIEAICARIPTGAGSRQAPKASRFDEHEIAAAAIMGVSRIGFFGIPLEWAERCEVGVYGRHLVAGHALDLGDRVKTLFKDNPRIVSKLCQLGSYGGGNHFGEAQTVTVPEGMEALAGWFGIKSGKVGFLSHCGSRGFGFQLAASHFKGLENHFHTWGIPLPGGERELIHAPLGTQQAIDYLTDMCLGANFAVVNHLLINRYVLEAFQEVFPGTKGDLVYHVSHNILREEAVNGSLQWVGRKGATRAFPAGHHALKGTLYANTGHPILLPGNPEAGSYIMVGQAAAEKTAFSINHGAGRAMGRNQAKRELVQKDVDAQMAAHDIMYNGRSYPLDESPVAYKDFNAVIDSVEQAGLAKTVAKLTARFVIKDNDQSAEGAA